MMGSPKTEKDRFETEVQHKRRIDRTFAIAAKSVTLAEYRSLTKDDYEIGEKYTYSPDLAVVGINWYMAANYCNLLSKEEHIPEDQWCYGTDKKGQVTKLKANYLQAVGLSVANGSGVRIAIRAGSTTSRYYGETDELLGHYAWYTKNTGDRLQRVGMKKPNDFGLFDVQGNCFTWCQEPYRQYPKAEGNEPVEDSEVPPEDLAVISTDHRVLRRLFVHQSCVDYPIRRPAATSCRRTVTRTTASAWRGLSTLKHVVQASVICTRFNSHSRLHKNSGA